MKYCEYGYIMYFMKGVCYRSPDIKIFVNGLNTLGLVRYIMVNNYDCQRLRSITIV